MIKSKVKITIFVAVLVMSLPSYASLRDPTQPLDADKAIKAEQPLVLQAIFFTTSSRYVVINNRSLYLGQKLNGWTVKRISRKNVQLERQGQSRELFLRSSVSRAK